MSLNKHRADCGFDPHANEEFVVIEVSENTTVPAFDLEGKTNILIVNTAGAGQLNYAIQDFVHMQNGKVYRFINKMGDINASFPQATALLDLGENADVTHIVTEFFTDGRDIYETFKRFGNP